jgi:hypothetical protein
VPRHEPPHNKFRRGSRTLGDAAEFDPAKNWPAKAEYVSTITRPEVSGP